MLLGGGNAFDALVAAGFAAAVTEPVACYSLTCESVFMLYDADSGDLLSLSGQGTAPRQATLDFFRGQGLHEIPTGPGPLAHLSFTVPGAVDGYLSLLERYGTLPLSQVLEPAIHLAQAGFPNYEYMIDALDSQATRDQFDQYPPGGNEIFYQDGKLPQPGSLLVQPGLARTLRRLAANDAGGSRDRIEGIRAARRNFYQGDLARTLVDCARRAGGILRAGDLAGYRAKFEEPARTRYRGYEICCQRTWSQAPLLLQTLNLLEHFDLRAMGHNSPAYVHTLVEAMKLAIADREAFYGDPDFARVPLDGLLSKEYAAERVRLIDPEQGASRRAGGRRSLEALPGTPESSGSRSTASVRTLQGTHLRGAGDDAHRRGGSSRQPGVRHTQRRVLRQVGLLPRDRLHPEHPKRNVLPEAGPSQLPGAGKAAPDHPGRLPGGEGRATGHDGGLPGRRLSGPGQPPAPAQRAGFRNEHPGGHRGPPLRKRQPAELLLSPRLLPGATLTGGGLPRIHPPGAGERLGHKVVPALGSAAWAPPSRGAIRPPAPWPPEPTPAEPATPWVGDGGGGFPAADSSLRRRPGNSLSFIRIYCL